MSVVTILKGKEKWPEIYNFLKESSPSLEDFEEIGVKSNIEIAQIVDEVELSKSESTRIDYYSEYLFALSLCRRLDQYKDYSAKSLMWSFEYVKSQVQYSDFIRKKAEELETLLYSYINGVDIDFSVLVYASHFSDTVEKAGLLYTGATNHETNQNIEAALELEISQNVIDILHMMVEMFEKTFTENDLIHSTSIVIYHPHFDPWGHYLGGASADLYIDGYIYELKSGKREKHRWIDIGQVYAYYLLNQLCEQNKVDFEEDSLLSQFNLDYNKVEGIALYYSRTGVLKRCPVKLLNESRGKKDELILRNIIATQVNYGQNIYYQSKLRTYADVILRTRYFQIRSGKRQLVHYESEKEYPHQRGERIYLLEEGWGTIERITRADGQLYALVSMENGKHLRFSINKVETISVNDPELLEKVGKLNLLPE